MNHYELLGVAVDADAAVIRRAYLALARTAHPDFHVGEPEAQRRSDPETRAARVTTGAPWRRAARRSHEEQS